MSIRVCLFSSYFSSQNVPEYIKFYIEQLRPHFDRLVFITNEEKQLDENAITWLAEHTDHWMSVKNEGYDFGMWSKALATIDASQIDELCLTNDSCICFKPLTDTIEHARGGEAAIGLVKSYEITEHLQSYFLIFRDQAIPIVLQHLSETDFSVMNYRNVVEHGELELSRKLLKAHIKLHGLYATEENEKINPSFYEIYPMLKTGIPLVKRKLLNTPASSFAISHNIRKGHPSNPNNLIQYLKTQSNHETHGFLDEHKQSQRKLLPYYRRFVRYYLKWKIVHLARWVLHKIPPI